MKKTILTIAISVLGLHSYSQTNTTNEVHYTCDKITCEENSDHIYLHGNVTFDAENFSIKTADKIIYNQKTNEIKAYGVSGFTIIEGQARYDTNKDNNNPVLRYKLGETVVYIN